MNNKQRDEFNLQIRKILKQFGVKAHSLVAKRFEKCKTCFRYRK